MEVLETLTAQADVTRGQIDERLAALSQAVDRLSERLAAQSAQEQLLLRIADGQDRLVAALTGPESSLQTEAENRMRLRSIDVQLLRILEEMSAGRQEAVADLRADLTAVTAAIRQLSRGTVGRG